MDRLNFAGVVPARPTLTKQELKVLSWAVREAAAWRGALVGNPDPVPLQEFDACIKIAKAAVKKLRRVSTSQL